METTLSLKEEIDLLAADVSHKSKNEKKVNSESLNELRFKELKNILAKFNKEYLFNDYMRKSFLNRPPVSM